ncbi:MAG: hypothetical protein BWY66_02053 [bacterium ADurb.Bin374]|nr:MAG: hypothetical protein BWY66_02053 [bacterium ADurb.Bin374]
MMAIRRRTSRCMTVRSSGVMPSSRAAAFPDLPARQRRWERTPRSSDVRSNSAQPADSSHSRSFSSFPLADARHISGIAAARPRAGQRRWKAVTKSPSRAKQAASARIEINGSNQVSRRAGSSRLRAASLSSSNSAATSSSVRTPGESRAFRMAGHSGLMQPSRRTGAMKSCSSQPGHSPARQGRWIRQTRPSLAHAWVSPEISPLISFRRISA